MTKDRVFIFNDKKGMQKYTRDIDEYYFEKSTIDIDLLARDPDAAFILTETEMYIFV